MPFLHTTMRIKSLIALGAALIGFSCAPLSAQIINSSTPIPDELVLLNFNSTGLDWVYAGPLRPNAWGPFQIAPVTYRAAEGWRYANASEWDLRPDWQDFYLPGHEGEAINHGTYRFASEYWSTFTWVDTGDAAQGYLTNGDDLGNASSLSETWYVRSTRDLTPVPEPSTYGLMAAAALLVGITLRRRFRK